MTSITGWRIVVGADDAGVDYKNILRRTWRPTTGSPRSIDVGVNDRRGPTPPTRTSRSRRPGWSPPARPTARCWCAAPDSAWPSAPTRCPASGPSPPTTASRSNARCCRTTPRCCASASASSASSWPAGWPRSGWTTSSTRPRRRRRRSTPSHEYEPTSRPLTITEEHHHEHDSITDPHVDLDFSLAGKAAVVTGGASGIGAAIASAFAAKGATGRDPGPVAGRRRRAGARTRRDAHAAFACDVSSPAVGHRGSRPGPRPLRPHRHPGQLAPA